MRVMRLDHVSYVAGPDGLASTVQRLGGDLGAGFVDGGIHPRFGTRNFVLPLAGPTYLEVVGILDHPAVDRAPFGRAVKARTERGGGWLAWVLSTDDLAPIATRLGRDPRPGNRHLPDGTELRWHQVGVADLASDAQLPFFIQWDLDSAPHPSQVGGGGGGVRIERLEIAGDPQRVLDWLGDPVVDPLAGVAVDWVDGDEPGIVAVSFATPHGSVRID